jgi:hypothetical protein
LKLCTKVCIISQCGANKKAVFDELPQIKDELKGCENNSWGKFVGFMVLS